MTLQLSLYFYKTLKNTCQREATLIQKETLLSQALLEQTEMRSLIKITANQNSKKNK